MTPENPVYEKGGIHLYCMLVQPGFLGFKGFF